MLVRTFWGEFEKASTVAVPREAFFRQSRFFSDCQSLPQGTIA
jgi:hypothetical protein